MFGELNRDVVTVTTSVRDEGLLGDLQSLASTEIVGGGPFGGEVQLCYSVGKGAGRSLYHGSFLPILSSLLPLILTKSNCKSWENNSKMLSLDIMFSYLIVILKNISSFNQFSLLCFILRC